MSSATGGGCGSSPTSPAGGHGARRRPDAVLAEYASQAADPGEDPTRRPRSPSVRSRGTLDPVPGAKKMTNVASVRGRGPEQDVATRPGVGDRAPPRPCRLRLGLRADRGAGFPRGCRRALPAPHRRRWPPGAGLGGPGAGAGPTRRPEPRPTSAWPAGSLTRCGPRCPWARRWPCCARCTSRSTRTRRCGCGVALRRLPAATRWLPLSTPSPPRHPSHRWGLTLDASTRRRARAGAGGRRRHLLRAPLGRRGVEVVEVDPCRGLYCSSRDHQLACEEQL